MACVCPDNSKFNVNKRKLLINFILRHEGDDISQVNLPVSSKSSVPQSFSHHTKQLTAVTRQTHKIPAAVSGHTESPTAAVSGPTPHSSAAISRQTHQSSPAGQAKQTSAAGLTNPAAESESPAASKKMKIEYLGSIPVDSKATDLRSLQVAPPFNHSKPKSRAYVHYISTGNY